MKKIAFFTALLALAFAVNAQSLNVQSAMSDLKRGYLNKAKAAIDKACVHEDTKNDAKTWYYAGLIYSQIGGESTKPKSKYKDLDPDWCQKAYDAAMRCKELDKTNDYANEIKDIFRFVGNNFYSKSIDLYNANDYTQALSLAQEAIKIFNNAGDPEYANESYYIAGLCCMATQDTVGIKNYFGALARKTIVKGDIRNRMPRVYNTMLSIYKATNDTANVVKTAERYTKVFANDPNAQLMLADAYIWMGNSEKGISMANKALDNSKDSVYYPMILCAAAGIFEQSGDFATAEAKYRESALLQPQQLEANYGMGIMLYNRAVDKIDVINKMIAESRTSDEDLVVMDKLSAESNLFFEQAIPYLKAAIDYIDGLPENQKLMNRPNLFNCLKTLNTCYVRLDMLNESTPIKARIKEIEDSARSEQ